MLVLGVKLTHDGGVACVEDGRLLFSLEAEKLDNRKRYSEIDDLGEIERMLRLEGLALTDVDRLVVDGWGSEETGALDRPIALDSTAFGERVTVPVAPYHEAAGEPVGLRRAFDAPTGGMLPAYASYSHVAGHVFGAYGTSPFAADEAPSLVLVWDGAIFPRLYGVDPPQRTVESLGLLMPIAGSMFTWFATNLPPFETGRKPSDELGVAGKAMAYAALGRPRPEVAELVREIAAANPLAGPANELAADRLVQAARRLAEPADLIAAMQDHLGDELVAAFRARLTHDPRMRRYANVCLAGGCALNIKWNSKVRDAGLFADVWVPPFPNDAGSAIGAACAEMVSAGGPYALEWDVFRGPELAVPPESGVWSRRDCSPEELGWILHHTGDPVVVLQGRAELGPRALGHRSVLAPAVRPEMKDRLNAMKGREDYRPVAPICLEERAPEIFAPGTRDPYMLFDHVLGEQWIARIPAVLHLDGTARLQTVARDEDLLTWRILHGYERESGLPALCNTSANFKGRGFFPSVEAAMEWDQAPRVWSRGVLYEAPWVAPASWLEAVPAAARGG